MASRKKTRDVKGIRGALYRAGQLPARTSFAADALANFLRLRIHRNGSRPSIAAVVVVATMTTCRTSNKGFTPQLHGT